MYKKEKIKKKNNKICNFGLGVNRTRLTSHETCEQTKATKLNGLP